MSFGFSVGDFITAMELANKIRKEFANAPRQFNDISDELRSLSIVLQDLDIDLFHQQLNAQEKAGLESIAHSCRTVLDDLEQTLSKYGELDLNQKAVGKVLKRVWKRLTWEPEDIRELRNRISSNVVLLNAFTDRIARNNVTRLVQDRDNEESRIALDWLSDIDYGIQQSEFINRRQPGTGQWLLDSDEYRGWLKTSRQTLFCPGIPGAGKTILASIVIDDLITRFQNDSAVGIAYIYFNFRLAEEQQIDDIFANLLKQLSREISPIPEIIKALYNEHMKKKKRPSLDDILRALRSVAATYSKFFIVVDALDECQASSGCRTKFLSELFNIQMKCELSIFATSRFITDIVKHFKDSISLEIIASTADVERYLDGHMELLPSFVRRNPQLQKEIKSGISKAVDGMFLLAQIYLGSLDDKPTPRAIRGALESFRKHDQALGENGKVQILDHAYDQSMERINGQKPGFRDLAKKMLAWIIYAKRQLKISELQHALAVEIGDSELDQDNIPDLECMISVCAGLVTVNEESNIISLVHYTTLEYFERTKTRWFPSAEIDIAAVCATYLSFSAFETGHCKTLAELTERFRLHCLFDYVGHNWGHHVRESSTCSKEVLEFLNCNQKVEASSQVLTALRKNSWYGYGHPQVPWTGLYLAAYFGIQEVVKTLLGEHNPDLRDVYGRTPLFWGAENGHQVLVQLMLEKGADPDSKDKDGYTPLLKAAENGHEEVVKLLLSTGRVDVNSKDTRDHPTPLLLAAANGYQAVVRLLIDNGADIECKDSRFSSTPMLWAAWKGREAVVRVLLEKGANPEPRNFYNSTPLSLAVQSGHVAVVQLLLPLAADRTIDADAEDQDGKTALSHAAELGDETLVDLLLSVPYVNADSRDEDYRTPLSWAAQFGNESVVKQLLAIPGLNAGSKDLDGYTPRCYAIKNGHEGVVKLLLDKVQVMSAPSEVEQVDRIIRRLPTRPFSPSR